MTLRSTLHLALDTEATDADLPFGVVTCTPSHLILIPSFLLFRLSAFTTTFVSNSIFNGSPDFFFRSDLKEVTESASRTCEVVCIGVCMYVMFVGLLVKDLNEPWPISTSEDVRVVICIGS